MAFEKGQSGNPGGRPKGSKNKLTLVKDKLVQIALSRFNDPEVWKEIPPGDLMRFIASITPKDMSIKVSPDITYVSHTPRPQEEAEAVKQIIQDHDEVESENISEGDGGENKSSI